jgi:spore coat polysaccharide biosynthesis protein SpsF (cytidylyltransferase family)
MDDPIHLFCKKYKIPCYRGSLSNVAERFIGVLDENCFDAFVRVNGDSPLLDQRLVEQGLEIFRNNSHFDIVTNVFPRTYPKGQSVEVLKSAAFRAAFPFFQEVEDKEHVTTYFYRNNGNFKIINFSSERNNGHIQLSIDTSQDMNIFERIISSMTRPHWEYTLDNILELYHKVAAF